MDKLQLLDGYIEERLKVMEAITEQVVELFERYTKIKKEVEDAKRERVKLTIDRPKQ